MSAKCHRILHKGCRLCINIGDQFARSVYYGRYKVIPIRTEIIKFCESAGFDYMGAIIWQKVTTCHTTGGATVMGSFPYPRSGILKVDYEFILSGQKVFIRFDITMYDEKNNLLCYLYLWNKTFLNAHLIKNGLADLNTSFDYKYKSKFLSERTII